VFFSINVGHIQTEIVSEFSIIYSSRMNHRKLDPNMVALWQVYVPTGRRYIVRHSDNERQNYHIFIGFPTHIFDILLIIF